MAWNTYSFLGLALPFVSAFGLLASITRPLNDLPGVNLGTVDSAISMASPVCGLRPFLAAR